MDRFRPDASTAAVVDREALLIVAEDCVEGDVWRIGKPAGFGILEERLHLLPTLVGEELWKDKVKLAPREALKEKRLHTFFFVFTHTTSP